MPTLLDVIDHIDAGGPGSGCHGPNCGRHPGHGTFKYSGRHGGEFYKGRGGAEVGVYKMPYGNFKVSDKQGTTKSMSPGETKKYLADRYGIKFPPTAAERKPHEDKKKAVEQQFRKNDREKVIGGDHPFAGGRRLPITKAHEPLIWENMLGTVYGRDPVTGETKYFDYDYKAARKFAGVDNMSDLRVDRYKHDWWQGPGEPSSPRKGQMALFGVPKKAI